MPLPRKIVTGLALGVSAWICFQQFFVQAENPEIFADFRPAANEQSITIEAVAEQSSAYGTWDGVDTYLPAIWLPVVLSSSPDLFACVVTVSGPIRCALRLHEGHWISHCPDSLRCRFVLPVPRQQPFAIAIFDQDETILKKGHDLVDIVVFNLGNDDSQARGVVDKRARVFAERLSPTAFPRPSFMGLGDPIVFRSAERARRSKAHPYVTPNDLGEEPLSLSQSQISILSE